MNNSDMPAMPCQVSVTPDRTGQVPYQFGNNDFVAPGLTKREYFAAHAPEMPAWFNNKYPEIDGIDRLVAWRYAYADAMLKEKGE